MIISASRRTDIPAFFSDWFINRIKDGNVCVRNPMNIHQVSRISLSPSVVDCIVFWTKNPAPMLSKLSELCEYDYYFQYTLNNYGKETEPHIPSLDNRINTFKVLSNKIGKERVIWRYDPIIITPEYDIDFHINSIRQIAKQLNGYTEKCVFSFVDVYPTKNMKNLNIMNNRPISNEEIEKLLVEMTAIAKENNLVLATCAEKIDLEKYDIQHNSCIDGKLIERITGYKLKTKLDGQREACQCVKCEEIGSYDTCPHGCTYCYANFRAEATKEKLKQYDPDSPILCDRLSKGDIISDRPVKSIKVSKITDSNNEQITLF